MGIADKNVYKGKIAEKQSVISSLVKADHGGSLLNIKNVISPKGNGPRGGTFDVSFGIEPSKPSDVIIKGGGTFYPGIILKNNFS